jgi:hypothetical protein
MAAAYRTKIPATARIASFKVAIQAPTATILPDYNIPSMNVEHAVWKTTHKSTWINPLPCQMGRVEGETKLRAAINRFQRRLGTGNIKSNLAGMNFQGEAHTQVSEFIQNRKPTSGEFTESVAHLSRCDAGVANRS